MFFNVDGSINYTLLQKIYHKKTEVYYPKIDRNLTGEFESNFQREFLGSICTGKIESFEIFNADETKNKIVRVKTEQSKTDILLVDDVQTNSISIFSKKYNINNPIIPSIPFINEFITWKKNGNKLSYPIPKNKKLDKISKKRNKFQTFDEFVRFIVYDLIASFFQNNKAEPTYFLTVLPLEWSWSYHKYFVLLNEKRMIVFSNFLGKIIYYNKGRKKCLTI